MAEESVAPQDAGEKDEPLFENGQATPDGIKNALEKFTALRQSVAALIQERKAAGKHAAAGRYRLRELENRVFWLQGEAANPSLQNSEDFSRIITMISNEYKWSKNYLAFPEVAELKTPKEFRDDG